MATFHINGKIISPPNKIVSDDPQVLPVSNNKNTIRSTYASKIVAKNQTVFANESTTSDAPQVHIEHISESQTLNTLQQPQQKNNNVAFAAFGAKRTKNKGFPCTQDNVDQSHPENPCFICFFGRWVHLDDLKPSKCGQHIIDKDNTCTFKDYIQPPCYGCDDQKGPYLKCKNCEICKEEDIGQYVCVDNCPEGYSCSTTDDSNNGICRKRCSNNSDCDWFNCEECNNLGECVSVCGSGDTCDAGICRSNCYPLCDPDNCETCEYKNGVYGCQGLPPDNGGFYKLVCCKGKQYLIDTTNECERWDQATCTFIKNICPPNTICYLNKCKPICTSDIDCNSACCELCVAQENNPNIKLCESCSGGGVCLDGVCKQNDDNRSIVQELQDVKKCNGCQRLSFRNIPGCEQDGACLKSECYECIDYCAELSQRSSKFSFECKEMSSGKFECQAYDLQILSSTLLP